MATIVYLDAEDEITSAAARIRQATDARVAIVIPFGSRVATSRINFRLLAREAMVSGRRLDIVAPDASARALAASAGLAVFASVAEYEDALDAPAPDDPAPAVAPRGTSEAAVAAGIAAATRPAPGSGGTAGREDATRRLEPAAVAAGRDAQPDAAIRRDREVPVARPSRRRPGAGLMAGVLVLLLALVVGGIAAFLFLPAAEIAITPRIEPVGPLDLVVTADPAATAVDEQALVIPAQTITVPVEVSGEFQATGRRVESTAATGGVRWRNCDPTAAYTVPAGTVVRTGGGIGFATDEAVFLPVAQISGSGPNVDLRCQSSEVSVTAVDRGPGGNVDAGAIRVVPARYNRTVISVTNPAATTGGTREEFTRIHRRDVDAALATLTEQLGAEVELQLEDPSGVPAGATVFPETAVIGEAAPTVDLASLVNQEVETFQLGLAATASVLAVDASPVEAIAASALEGSVQPGYTLVDGSTRIAVGEGTVDGDRVEFRVAGVARQLRPLDAEALRREVLGLPADQARAVLGTYGDVELALWPGFVTTVPTIEQRVSLVVREPIDETPDVDPVPATPDPTEPPTSSPTDETPSQPVPSG